jgi:hypothetical protein
MVYLGTPWVVSGVPIQQVAKSLPPASPQDSFSVLAGVSDSLRGKDALAAFLESWRGLPKQNLRFSPRCLTDLASIARDFATMRTLAVIFVLALIAIAGGICSDPVLMSGTAPHADPDPVSLAVAHAVRSRPESRP